MKVIYHIFFLLVSIFCFGQRDENWYVFYNSDSTKIGYKDAFGNVKIEPKFEQAMTNSKIFRDVVLVWEYAKDYSGEKYYLNKEGKKFGKDSVYVSDFIFAEESEGKIKFQDYKNDKVGFFDKNGKVVIPANYNEAGDFQNGIAKVLKNAKRWCYDTNSEIRKNCEHFGWKDGVCIIINEKNQELFTIPERTDFSYSIDYSRLKINENVDCDVYISYKGNDGKVYSFYSPEKDFEKWFDKIFFPDFKKYKTVLPKYFYDLISVSDNNDINQNKAWKNHKKSDYLKKNLSFVNEIFENLKSGKFQNNISWETYSNSSYFPENELPREDLTNNITIGFLPRAKNDYSAKNQFQFTKIGDSFYITSAP
jgi:hypothetical protein